MKKIVAMLIKMGLLLLFSSWILRCIPDAPHGNPLDPYHDRQSGIVINGQVLQKNNTNIPIDSCQIFLTPGNLFTVSDQSGRFYFKNLLSGLYQITIAKSKYETENKFIQTDTLGSQPLIVRLNGFPLVKRLYFYSQFIDQWWPDSYHAVVMDLLADDPDGIPDIVRISLDIPEFGSTYTLAATSRPDSFTITLRETGFPDNNIFNVIGKEVFVDLVDRSDSIQREGPFFIHRIMEISPVPLAPTGLTTVTNQPLFIWQAYPAQFEFQFEVQVFYLVASIPNLIHTARGIPSTQLEYQYPDTLQTGQYYWVVFIRDEIGNLSRSREASFQVE